MSKAVYENRETSFALASLRRYRVRQGYCEQCGVKIRGTIGSRICQKCRGKRMRGVPKGLK